MLHRDNDLTPAWRMNHDSDVSCRAAALGTEHVTNGSSQSSDRSMQPLRMTVADTTLAVFSFSTASLPGLRPADRQGGRDRVVWKPFRWDVALTSLHVSAMAYATKTRRLKNGLLFRSNALGCGTIP
jgi:hypothetical protein